MYSSGWLDPDKRGAFKENGQSALLYKESLANWPPLMQNQGSGTEPLSQSRINAKHHYRFKYLKSEHWQNLRIAKLASVDAECKKCGKRDLSNDVHHLRYKSLYDVELTDLVVLCRECHDFAHEALDLCRNRIKKDNNSWKATELVISILQAAKMHGLETEWLSEPDMNKKVNGFWKKVKEIRKTSPPEWMPRDVELRLLKKAMDGCSFPDFQYFMFDSKGKKS